MVDEIREEPSLTKAELYLTTKQYDNAINEYTRYQDENSLSLEKNTMITNRILHCKFMIKGVLDCRKHKMGIYHNAITISYTEALEIVGELEKKHPDRKFAKSSSSENFGTYYGMSPEKLEELKAKYNKEKNVIEARKVRAVIRKLKVAE